MSSENELSVQKTFVINSVGRGRPRKYPKDWASVVIRLCPELHQKLRHLAVDKNVSVNELILEVIESSFK